MAASARLLINVAIVLLLYAMRQYPVVLLLLSAVAAVDCSSSTPAATNDGRAEVGRDGAPTDAQRAKDHDTRADTIDANRDGSPSDSQPRDSQPRDSQPRDSQPRDSQPADQSFVADAPRDQGAIADASLPDLSFPAYSREMGQTCTHPLECRRPAVICTTQLGAKAPGICTGPCASCSGFSRPLICITDPSGQVNPLVKICVVPCADAYCSGRTCSAKGGCI
ncbi:MAG: hypothetical protein H6707_09095 [Deltaproteobacteria bacterium]|nr:hypothetical protein [Deltaproteobacteria bacterium]